jgi:hypothetical protein
MEAAHHNVQQAEVTGKAFRVGPCDGHGFDSNEVTKECSGTYADGEHEERMVRHRPHRTLEGKLKRVWVKDTSGSYNPNTVCECANGTVTVPASEWRGGHLKAQPNGTVVIVYVPEGRVDGRENLFARVQTPCVLIAREN